MIAFKNFNRNAQLRFVMLNAKASIFMSKNFIARHADRFGIIAVNEIDIDLPCIKKRKRFLT